MVKDKRYYLETGLICKIQLPIRCEQVAMHNVLYLRMKGTHLLIKRSPNLAPHLELAP